MLNDSPHNIFFILKEKDMYGNIKIKLICSYAKIIQAGCLWYFISDDTIRAFSPLMIVTFSTP